MDIEIIDLPVFREKRLFDDLEKGKDCHISTNNLSLDELISVGIYLIKTGNKRISRICPTWDTEGLDSFIKFMCRHCPSDIAGVVGYIYRQPGCSIIINHIAKKRAIRLPFYSDACIEYMRIAEPPGVDCAVRYILDRQRSRIH